MRSRMICALGATLLAATAHAQNQVWVVGDGPNADFDTVQQGIDAAQDGDTVFKISPTAIDVNDTRGLHVATLTRDARLVNPLQADDAGANLRGAGIR